jgi:hypothetical protein
MTSCVKRWQRSRITRSSMAWRWSAIAGLANRHWLTPLPTHSSRARQRVRHVLGTQTGSTVPLGAFYRSVTVDAPQQPAAMLAAAHKTLEREENPVVVDDAQLLDRFRHLAANKRLRPPMRSSLGPAPPSPKPAPWSRESAGRSPVVPRAGAAPRPIYPCGSALRCRRTAARPCCSTPWMCWSQPHSPSLVW